MDANLPLCLSNSGGPGITLEWGEQTLCWWVSLTHHSPRYSLHCAAGTSVPGHSCKHCQILGFLIFKYEWPPLPTDLCTCRNMKRMYLMYIHRNEVDALCSEFPKLSKAVGRSHYWRWTHGHLWYLLWIFSVNFRGIENYLFSPHWVSPIATEVYNCRTFKLDHIFFSFIC